MKKVIFLSSLFIFLILRVSNAEVIWQEHFDGFGKDWTCCLDDCSITPGVPPGFIEFHSNTFNAEKCNALINTDAARTTGVNKRGFRIYLRTDTFPTGENVLRKDLGDNKTLIYLRWYQRDSSRTYTNFQKLFRLKQSSGQILIPEWQVNNSHIQMNLWSASDGNNHFFTGYNLDTDYIPGTWKCYEIKIDMVNKQTEFWVDGVSKGIQNATWWSDGWYIRYIEIGGNQYGHIAGNTIDYDDIVVSTSYIGPDTNTVPDTVPDTVPPNPPVGLRIVK
jgi:hypothetical protein